MDYKLFKGPSWLISGELKPLEHIQLCQPMPIFEKDEDDNYIASYVNKIVAQTVDMSEKAIVEAIVNECVAQGITDLYLIDKEFIVSAVKHEIIRRKGEKK